MCFLMAGFFRKSLQLGGKHSIALSEELSLVQTFLAIEEVRFRERLLTRFAVADDTLTLAVPPLVLQPLVENAVRHGIARRTGPGRIEVRAWRENATLKMSVLNDGAGWNLRAESEGGLGLANTRARLAQHFQNRYRFDLREAGDRGALAEIAVPVRTCPSAR
jgi:two-component system sensor histidine kinase AlgZ